MVKELGYVIELCFDLKSFVINTYGCGLGKVKTWMLYSSHGVA